MTEQKEDNPHNRPIRLEAVVLADNEAALVHRLRALADLVESGRLGNHARGSTGGNSDDCEYQITAIRKNSGEMNDAMEDSSHLTPAEAERLTLLSKGMGVALRLVRTILKHGYDGSNPFSGDTATNRQMLEAELGDVRHAMIRLCNAGDLSKPSIHDWAAIKAVAAQTWLRHQDGAQPNG